MAESRMRISIYNKDKNYQVRIVGFSGGEGKTLRADLNVFPGVDALVRMEEYADLRPDEYFVSKSGEICFTCEYGRLALIRKFIEKSKGQIVDGADLVPDSEKADSMLARVDPLNREIAEIKAKNKPFYKKGFKALAVGLLLRISILLLLLIISRAFWLKTSDHYVPRSLQAIMHTGEIPYEKQELISYFIKPSFTHRSKLEIKRPLYIRGSNVILEGGHYIKIEGVGNLKATIEAHNNAPMMIKVDSRSGETRITGVYVGDNLVAPRGHLKYLGRIPVIGQQPPRVDALDTASSGAYVRVRSADPLEESTFNWMLGQTISLTASLTLDGDRYLIGEGDYYFAVDKGSVKPEIQEILDMAAISNQRVIFDMRLNTRPWPLRNRRDARHQRRDTNIITDGNLHFVTVQSAVLKNI
ncbi:MAG: hypothetical protein GY835_12425 [bacterium]|nr:hypothetical protein [bacterium]